jgi:hypothetical protein
MATKAERNSRPKRRPATTAVGVGLKPTVVSAAGKAGRSRRPDKLTSAVGVVIKSRVVSAAGTAGASREKKPLSSAAWIAAEVRRMKEANEIPLDITITDFSRMIAGRMQKAAGTNKPSRVIKWTSIKNKLRDWGLWPISSIK